jgi:short-chain fatty acids transporter
MSRIANAGAKAAKIAERVIPDPFVIAILLAGATLVWGTLSSEAGILSLMESFAAGMLATNLLAFAFKLALILVTGYALAEAPWVRKQLSTIANIPKHNHSAAALVCFVSMVLGLFNWGLGLVAGAFLAREVGNAFQRRNQSLNYPLIGAAGYMGLVVWHGGFSGSAPLAVAKEGPFGPPIPVSETIFLPLNLFVSIALLIALPLLFRLLGKSETTDSASTKSNMMAAPTSNDASANQSPKPDPIGTLSRFEHSPLISFCLGAPIFIALVIWFTRHGLGAVNLNSVILIFVIIGMALHRNAMSYARAFSDGTRSSAGILLQFPIYFGILAIAKESGILIDLAESLSGLASIFAPEIGAPLMTFFSAAVINLVIPSGGGQWALQRDIILETCQQLSIGRPLMVLAFSYGDQLTNMLQPFWALPLLSITGLRAGQVMGYTMVAMVVATPIFLIPLLVASSL